MKNRKEPTMMRQSIDKMRASMEKEHFENEQKTVSIQ